MKYYRGGLAALFLILALAGCEGTKSRAVEGSVIGGLLGATAGGIIGQQHHYGGQGAAIGAAAGIVTGAIVGAQIEKKSATSSPGNSAAGNPQQMTLAQIVDYTKQGVNENVIIDRIRMTNSRFSLKPEEITYLQSQGVSQRVIASMQGL